MTDYYLEDRIRLEGQPKRSIGDYVESEGILVPKRFKSLNDAKKSGRAGLARFEHSQDYDGASNLGPTGSINFPDSYSFSSPFSFVTNFKTESFDSSRDIVRTIREVCFGEMADSLKRDKLRTYCNLMNLNFNDFIKQASFSFWEFIPGINIAVVADSAIEGRTHVALQKTAGVGFINYAVIEPDGSLRLPLASDKFIFKGNSMNDLKYIPNTSYFANLSERLEQITRRAVSVYNKTRSLSRLDKNHSYIMEMQADNNGQIHLLQVHRTRDMVKPTFLLERELGKDEIEAVDVRGVTLPGGQVARINTLGGEGDYFKGNSLLYLDVHNEICSRKRKVQCILPGEDFLSIIVAHEGRSDFFKPELSLVVDYRRLFTKKEYEEGNAFASVHVVADGRRAIIKRIG